MNSDQNNWIDVAKRVVDNHQFEEIDNIILDAQTAGMLVAVHDTLSPETRNKFVSLSLPEAVEIGWKLVT